VTGSNELTTNLQQQSSRIPTPYPYGQLTPHRVVLQICDTLPVNTLIDDWGAQASEVKEQLMDTFESPTRAYMHKCLWHQLYPIFSNRTWSWSYSAIRSAE
jgi:hypothetical protein